MSDGSRAIAKQYLVDGRLQVDVAEDAGVSRERVRFVCAQVYEAYQRMATRSAGQVRAAVTNSDASTPALATANPKREQ